MNPQAFRRATGSGILIGLLIVFVAVLSVRCNDGESPVSFTPDLPDASTFTSSSSSTCERPTTCVTWAPQECRCLDNTGVQPPPSTNTPAKERYAYDILSDDDFFRVSLTLNGPIVGDFGRVGVACYENPDRTSGENQKYFSSHIHNILPGATRIVQAKLPECVFWQCDAFEGDPITNEDPFYGRRLIVGRSGGPQGECTPPPPCTNPPCNPPPPPSCEEELRVETSIDGGTAFIRLYNKQNQLVGSEIRQLTQQRQEGEICVGDHTEPTLRTLTTEEEPCCLPYVLPALPPPECDEKALRLKTEREANAACEHGVDKILLNLDECTGTFTCNPPPPTCEELNPRNIFSGSGTSSVANIGNGRRRVTVSASGSNSGAAFSGEIGILWRRSGSKFVKALEPAANRCGHSSGRINVSWDSTGSSHVACNANYSLIWYTNGNRSNPDIQREIGLNKTGLCSSD